MATQLNIYSYNIMWIIFNKQRIGFPWYLWKDERNNFRTLSSSYPEHLALKENKEELHQIFATLLSCAFGSAKHKFGDLSELSHSVVHLAHQKKNVAKFAIFPICTQWMLQIFSMKNGKLTLKPHPPQGLYFILFIVLKGVKVEHKLNIKVL